MSKSQSFGTKIVNSLTLLFLNLIMVWSLIVLIAYALKFIALSVLRSHCPYAIHQVAYSGVVTFFWLLVLIFAKLYANHVSK